LKNPVSLDAIKGDKSLQKIGLLKQTRLSVVALTRAEFDRILKLSKPG
jgi:predicted RNA-binding protein with PUA-like domain